MKKLSLLLLLATNLVWLAACSKGGTDFQELDDETLASSIADDRDKQAYDPETLPAEAIVYLAENHFDTYYEDVRFSRDRGYEVRLATDERVYFNLRGRPLRFRGGPLNGPCGAIGGELVRISHLRPAVTEYVAAHYPEAEILRAKQRGDKLILLLSGHIILVFSQDGVFELDVRQWYDCRCTPADQAAIPAAVLTMLANRIPDGEIKRVCQRGDRIVVGMLTPDGRVILVFDLDWRFLFAHR